MILEKQVAGLNQHTLERFVLRARRAVGLAGTVSVLVTGSAAVRSLNQRFRRQNKVTDVLSFPSETLPAESRRHARTAGDVAISADVARQNAGRLGHSAAQEVKILALHGILHLAGFDHERDHGEMARKELKLRRALGLPSGLLERVGHNPDSRGRGLRKSGTGKAALAASGRSAKIRRATPVPISRTA